MATTEAKQLRAVVNHVVLPPDLPGSVDKDILDINQILLLRLRNACSELKICMKGEYLEGLELLERSLDHCQSLHLSPHLDSAQLQRAFRTLQDGETLMIHVEKQNAGLLVRRGTGYGLQFRSTRHGSQADDIYQ